MKRKVRLLAFAMFMTAAFSFSSNAFVKVCAANNDKKCGYTNKDGTKVEATGAFFDGKLKEIAELLKEIL